jgi:hypothetical protein
MNRFHLTPLVTALSVAGLAQAATPAPTQLPTGGNVAAGTANIASSHVPSTSRLLWALGLV